MKNHNFLGPVEKCWIVEYAEKYKEMTRADLAQIFRAEFGRSIVTSTITRLMKQKPEILEMFASWAQNNSVKIRPQESDCKAEPVEVDLKSEITDKGRDRQ